MTTPPKGQIFAQASGSITSVTLAARGYRCRWARQCAKSWCITKYQECHVSFFQRCSPVAAECSCGHLYHGRVERRVLGASQRYFPRRNHRGTGACRGGLGADAVCAGISGARPCAAADGRVADCRFRLGQFLRGQIRRDHRPRDGAHHLGNHGNRIKAPVKLGYGNNHCPDGRFAGDFGAESARAKTPLGASAVALARWHGIGLCRDAGLSLRRLQNLFRRHSRKQGADGLVSTRRHNFGGV